MNKHETYSLKGPRGRFRTTFQLVSNPYKHYADWQDKYGQTFLVKALNGNVVATSNPENVRRILKARHEEISQFAIGTIAPLIGENSVILVSGKQHQRARSLLTPPFQGEYLRAATPRMNEIATRASQAFQCGQPVKIMDVSLDYSLDVIIEIVFGVQRHEKVLEFKQVIKDYVTSFRPRFAFTRLFQKNWLPGWNKFLTHKAHADRLLNAQIESTKQCSESQAGVLRMLLDARDDTGQPLSMDELKQQLITLLFAGHETTQIAIAWSMSWLHRNPQCLEALRNELVDSNNPSLIVESKLLHGVCMESLRLNTIVPDFLRVMETPLELEELKLPAGATVGILSCLVHCDPSIYSDPFKFNPGRWDNNKYKPHEFLAFGGGVRRCIGANMALMEMKIAIANWITRFEFSLPNNNPTHESIHRRNLTMAPKSGIPLNVVRKIQDQN